MSLGSSARAQKAPGFPWAGLRLRTPNVRDGHGRMTRMGFSAVCFFPKRLKEKRIHSPRATRWRTGPAQNDETTAQQGELLSRARGCPGTTCRLGTRPKLSLRAWRENHAPGSHDTGPDTLALPCQPLKLDLSFPSVSVNQDGHISMSITANRPRAFINCLLGFPLR